MTPRPLYRWKSFWLGVLVLGFLGWAWWLSYDYVSNANLGRMWVWQQEGYVAAGAGDNPGKIQTRHYRATPHKHISELLPSPFLVRGEGKHHLLAEVDEVDFQAWAKWFYPIYPESHWAAYVPHWLVMLAFLGPWAGFLVWRLRRQRMQATINS